MVDYAEPLLASAEELSARTGLPATDVTLLDALRDASRRFVGEVGHPVVLTEHEFVELDGPGTGVLSLPAAPVTAPLYLLAVDGRPLRAGIDYTLSRALGLVNLKGGRLFPRDFGCIQVEYSHGYTREVGSASRPGSIPTDIQGAVLEAAEIRLNVEAGVVSRTVLNDTVQFGSSAVGATQRWSDAVNRYARA